MREYEPFDQDRWLGPAPWEDTVALDEWEIAHGHDVRLKCYVEFGCMVIEPALERRIEKLETEIERWKRLYRVADKESAELEAERERILARLMLHHEASYRPVLGKPCAICAVVERSTG